MRRPDTRHSSRIQVAVITAPHGVRGQVKLQSFTQKPDDVFSYNPLTDEHGHQEYHIAYAGGTGDVMIVSIKDITDRNSAALLKGTALYVSADQFPITHANEWLYEELKGLEARLEDGTIYGKIVDVCNYGAGDIIEILRKEGGHEMLPFNKKFVGDVHASDGYLVVFPPEYLEGDKE